MIHKRFRNKDLTYSIRIATAKDADELSKVRVQGDGETENMDREKGEDYIDDHQFQAIIKNDADQPNHLFLVVDVDGEIAGYSRCAGSQLKRLAHTVEFGVCILKEFWGYGMATNLLYESIKWAESHGIKKITLRVIETNTPAIRLYRRHGFDIEGVLKKDKLLSDGHYYSTVLMSRFIE
ncbi:GNAT family N-acetyltransferase [Halobacillus locisalis]|uniref:GNAT family N-acetyltransferase n=1 Tax=Halobacillus locisalis TaxID=220753 RepID=A0A838CZ40_9BACI|nr:GNAT family N-acetyltransferase [Halobacillus locisalis]MBA2177020.1 GNAT family N-acetyltransferase [Halobacillus locisalis]